MTKPLLSHRRVFVIVAAGLLVSSLLPRSLASAVSAVPRHMVELLLTPIRHPLTALSAGVRPAPAARVPLPEYDELARQYLALKTLAERLEEELTRARLEVARLSNLRDYLKLQGVNFVPADVTARSLSSSVPVITINRGRRDGVVPGLAVTTGVSLLGAVTDSGPVTATVALLASPAARIEVELTPPTLTNPPRSLRLVLQPAGRSSTTSSAAATSSSTPSGSFIAVIDRDARAEVGDLALLADANWPRQAQRLLVGVVTRIAKMDEDPLLYRRVIVEPIESPATLPSVTVLVPVTADR